MYYPLGSIVSYDGHQYSALVSQVDFSASGWNPTMSNLWKDLGAQSGEGRFNSLGAWFARASNASNTQSPCALEWNADNVYTSGGMASVNGINYRANWWTQGESPVTHTSANDGQPWSMVGSCAESSKTAADSHDATSEGHKG